MPLSNAHAFASGVTTPPSPQQQHPLHIGYGGRSGFGGGQHHTQRTASTPPVEKRGWHTNPFEKVKDVGKASSSSGLTSLLYNDFRNSLSHGNGLQKTTASHQAWQLRKTHTPSPGIAAGYTSHRCPPSPGIRAGRSRETYTAQKPHTQSPVQPPFTTPLQRVPRASSPTLQPPKRVFSTPTPPMRDNHEDNVDYFEAGTNEAKQQPDWSCTPRSNRRPSMLWDGRSQFIIAPQTEEDKGKYCVVLDLDETLVYAREGPIQCRPGYKELMRVLAAHCETVVWTAGERSYAKEVLRQLDSVGAIRHCIYRHHLWFDGKVGQVKDLRLLGRDPDKVLLVENTPDCLRKNATQAVLVPDFRGRDDQGIITLLTSFVKDLAKSRLPVAQYLRSSPLITPREVLTNVGDTIICHTIGESEESFQNQAPNHDTIHQGTTPRYGLKW